MRAIFFFIGCVLLGIALLIVRQLESPASFWATLAVGAVGLFIAGWCLVKDWARKEP